MAHTLSLSALVAFVVGSTGGDLQIELVTDQSQSEKEVDIQSQVSLPSSCLGTNNGYQWMKLLDGDEYPAVHQLCDNEYMVIDINEDPNVADYFASYTTWHHSLGGDEVSSGRRWEEWWLPNAQFLDTQSDEDDEYFSYTISPDCSSCSVSNNLEDNYLSPWNTDTYGDRTAYHMTATIFGCLTMQKQEKDCQWDDDTYECSVCDEASGKSDQDLGYHVVWKDDDDFEQYANAPDTAVVGLCGVYPLATYNSSYEPQSRDQCVTKTKSHLPSIGNNGQFCVCVKPNESYDADTTHSLSVEDFKNAEIEYQANHAEEEEDTSSVDDLHELWQSDFANGTYRIQQSGTYKIMEDIVFDFNSGDDWWPRADQEQYPGAQTSRDEYSFGFFAGITVEADDVVIDLNGHEIKQSLAFYHQQRFFANIALKSVVFPLTQGPGFFGTEPVYASNVVIKNGDIGLSSHFGIHGHYNDDVVIENVHVYDFETHGIEMSYFNNLKMKNVEIGPSSNVAFMKGEYGYARWTLQRLNRVIDSEYNETAFPLKFDGRDEALSLQDIIDRLQDLVDIAFSVVMGTEQYDDDDADYIKAKELFINEDGLPYGAVMYGLFLNSWFSNVFSIHPTTHHSQGAQIENLKIHGMHHSFDEYLRLDNGFISPYQTMFGSSIDARAILGDQIESGQDLVWNETRYVGSALTDAFIALGIASFDWGELGLLYTDYGFVPWSLGEYTWTNDTRPYLGCNNDRMTHAPKGVIGIRMDGVNDVSFSNLEIYDLFEDSPMGSNLCGEYWEGDHSFTGGGHFLQNTPYFYGFTGNRVHGMFMDWANVTVSGEVSLHDLSSETGLVRGIGLYTESRFEVEDDAAISIYDLSAGTSLLDVDTESLPHPYAPAQTKPIHLLQEVAMTSEEFGEFGVIETYTYFYSEIVGDPKVTTPTVWCLYGRDGVNITDWTVSMVDDVDCSLNTILAENVTIGHHDALPFHTVLFALAAMIVVLTLSRKCLSGTVTKTLSTEYAPLLRSEL